SRSRDPARTAVIVVGRGASDPDANGDFCKVVRLFGEGRGLGWVVPSFVVVPYLLFGGRLIERLAEKVASLGARYPWIAFELAPHLGCDDRLFAILDERVRDAVAGAAPLPCDTCQYRLPIAGVTANVGGA